MNVEQLEDLKKKIETAKSDKAKAEGAIEQIEKMWKSEHQCNSLEDVNKLLISYSNQIKTSSEKLNKLLEEIEQKIPADVT